MSGGTSEVALVFGGSGEIGLEISASLAGLGYDVVLAARSAEGLENAVQNLRDRGVEARRLECDIRDESQVKATLRSVKEDFGRLDVLVNAAGVSESGLLARASDEHWRNQLEINLMGSAHTCKAALSLLRRDGGGHVINIGSTAARDAHAGFAAYSASKAGLLAMARCLQEEAARVGVRVTTICPDRVNTSMHGQENPERAEMIAVKDVAAAVSFVLGLSSTAHVAELFLEARPGLSEHTAN